MAIAVLAVLGLVLGSFVNALVWRLHEQGKALGPKAKNLSILRGRSVCPNCRHELAAKDLAPVLSWLFLRGRCRYCSQPISIQYPLVELTMAATFITSYLWWPGSLSGGGQRTLLVTWLICSVGLLALLIYDFKWQLLPNRIIYPILAVAVAGRLVYLLGFSNSLGHDFLQWFFSLVVASGLFLALYLYSSGRWIGYGDVRLGLVTGTLLASALLAFSMIFLASIFGLVFALPALTSGRKALTSRIPYGPFLIFATYIMVLFGQHLIDWYQSLLP